MNLKPLISVIVPVYNVEAYLNRCISSILNQSYNNLEVILVNDGSTDESGEICNKYASIDTRVKVIHKENGGLSDARNKGLECFSGNFITFIDSDDFVHIKYIETLYNICKKSDLKVAICNYLKTSESTINNVLKNEDISTISSREALSHKDGEWNTMMITAWGKLFHKSLWNELRFPKGMLYEDSATIYKAIYAAEEVAYTLEPLYYYYFNENSIMNSSYSLKKWDCFPINEEKIEFYRKNNELVLAHFETIKYLGDVLNHYYYCNMFYKKNKN